MDAKRKRQFLVALDDELLLGGAVISEWSAFLIRDADEAFIHGAHLAALITAIAAIESHLRFDCRPAPKSWPSFFELINVNLGDSALAAELHALRRYRNQWVHVSDAADDDPLLQDPASHEAELEAMATRAMRAMREIVYLDQCV